MTPEGASSPPPTPPKRLPRQARAIYLLHEGTGAADRGEPRPRRIYNKVERRAAKYRNLTRGRAAQHQALKVVLDRLKDQGVEASFRHLCGSPSEDGGCRMDWDGLPATCDPMRAGNAGGLRDTDRAQRKRWQCESIYVLLRGLVEAMHERRGHGDTGPLRVVDFASATGIFSLPLAALFPECIFTLVDINDGALNLAAETALTAGLGNVKMACCAIQDYDGQFDIALGMHACGFLSDLVQVKAMERQAAYIICPCCVGNIRQSVELAMEREGTPMEKPFKTNTNRLTTAELFANRFDGRAAPVNSLQHPRSELMRSALTMADFLLLVKASDYSGESHEEMESFRLAKDLIEVDRDLCAREAGYWTAMTKLSPIESSPKHDVLVGLPPGVQPRAEWLAQEN